RDPLADPDAFESYEAGAWWNNRLTQAWTHRLQLPMDSRAVASPTAPDEYVFYRHGGWSWSIPYLAASYALALQVDPALTPDAFLDLAMETGRTIDWDTGARIVELGPILEPAALIAALQNG
ncbi:MAG: hypothetical protein P8129_23500, partial [Anaerolineae bacterium]